MDKIRKTKIRIIGIGGGGGTIVSEIAQRLPQVNFAVANCDLQALRKIGSGVFRFQFGQNLTGGLGTGMNVEIAREAAINEREKIKKLLSGYNLCIIIASLGGGAGSGASPIFAKIAKNLGIVTLGIFTLPFKFEGEKKMEIAKTALQELKPNLNTLIILPNEKIFQVIDKNTPLKEALSFINKNLADDLQGLVETIYLPGLINIDFADFKTILEPKGKLAFLNSVILEKEKTGIEALKRVFETSLYPYDIKGARGVLFNIAGQKDLLLSDVSQISKMISELVSPEAKIIFGISQGRVKYQDKIKITLLATGCLTKIFSEKTKKKRVKKKPIKKLPEAENPKAETPKTETPKAETPKIPTLEKKERKRKIKIRKKIEVLVEPKSEKIETKVRKTALQVKKEVEVAEKEILEKEEIWETPAFLRSGAKKI